MSAIAIGRPERLRREGALRGARQTVLAVLFLGVLWGLWEGLRWLGIRFGITFPFEVTPTAMPHADS